MLTIVTTPRPLHSGKFRMDFDNAIGSWLHLKPTPQIIIFGGDRSAVVRDGVTHVFEFPQNEQALPYLDGCLRIAQDIAEFDLMLLTSDHLILRSDFTVALKKMDRKFGLFGATGQRWDRLVDLPIDFNVDWETEIVQGYGRPRGGSAKDWFLFRMPLPFEVANFVLGRRRWDSWFLHRLCISGMPVVDVSCVVTPVHPIHCYSHVPGGECAAVELTDDPGTLHNMALEENTPSPNHITELEWGLTCDEGFLSGDDWEQWKRVHEKTWRYRRIDHQAWARLEHPVYCWDPPPGTGYHP